jgi:protoporphyrinogen oxidase
VLRDMATRGRRAAAARHGDGESFASALEASLGPTICHEFYFPYARKIWGAEPEELSAIQARRRVAARSFGKLARKVLAAVPGFRPPGAGRFYFPRGGFCQISEAYADAARRAGAELLLGWRVTAITRTARASSNGPGGAWCVTAECEDAARTLGADHVWSTLPITQLARLTSPAPSADVLAAAGALDYRAMLLIYLTIPVPRFTEFDAHYFPEAAVAITRLSEPKNYAALDEPLGSTTLCAELPCAFDDEHWRMDDAALAALVAADLARAGLPLPEPPATVHVRRLRFAYPIYRRRYEDAFARLDRWAESQPGLLTFGRQGLFAHDNTHHALRMAYAAADCLGTGGFDATQWAERRREFETHVVED